VVRLYNVAKYRNANSHNSWLVAENPDYFARDVKCNEILEVVNLCFLQCFVCFGGAFFLVMLSVTSSYYMAMFCMAMAIGCIGMASGGHVVNPQDIAPMYCGAVFGE